MIDAQKSFRYSIRNYKIIEVNLNKFYKDKVDAQLNFSSTSFHNIFSRGFEFTRSVVDQQLLDLQSAFFLRRTYFQIMFGV